MRTEQLMLQRRPAVGALVLVLVVAGVVVYFATRPHGADSVAADLSAAADCADVRVSRPALGEELRPWRPYASDTADVICDDLGGSIGSVRLRDHASRDSALQHLISARTSYCRSGDTVLLNEMFGRGFDLVCHALGARRQGPRNPS